MATFLGALDLDRDLRGRTIQIQTHAASNNNGLSVR